MQALACVAHLATSHQYERLRQFVPTGLFAQRDQPLLDGWVLLYHFLETPQDDLRRLAEKASQLSAALIKRDEISQRLRRLACIDLELSAEDELRGTCRWHTTPADPASH